MALGDFLRKQFIDVIQWTEPEDGLLACRFPMQDMEIQTGAKLTVRESQMAAFVNEGKMADVFGPGLYTLNTKTLPVLTNLMNWDKAFQSPFKSDVYFFATRLQPAFTDFGLTLATFVIENLSLPDELQQRLDERIGMNIVGDLGRYAKFQVAQSIPTAAANPGGGGAGVGAGLGAGMAMAQSMMDALKPDAPGATKPCAKCGKAVPPQAKFCPECGAAQS